MKILIVDGIEENLYMLESLLKLYALFAVSGLYYLIVIFSQNKTGEVHVCLVVFYNKDSFHYLSLCR